MNAKRRPITSHRFAGISLSGGKQSKACVAFVDFFPSQKKLFLSDLYVNIDSEADQSADQRIVEILQSEFPLKGVAVDAALKLPKCLRCRLECPGYENCTEPEIEWMWSVTNKKNLKKKPKKLFTPYTQRCAEIYISENLEEQFQLGHALGANRAPVTARALFIKRRIPQKMIEVSPMVSVWRVGRALKVMKRYLRTYRKSAGGQQARSVIVNKIIESEMTFIYEQDKKTLIENTHALEAYICALTSFLKFRSDCEQRPKHFPRSEAWIEFPKKELSW